MSKQDAKQPSSPQTPSISFEESKRGEDVSTNTLFEYKDDNKINIVITPSTTDLYVIDFINKIIAKTTDNYAKIQMSIPQTDKERLLAIAISDNDKIKQARDIRHKYTAFGTDSYSTTDKLLKEHQVLVDKMKKVLNSASDASLAISMLLNDDTFQKIAEVEKQIAYRRFYFAGGPPKLILPGNGVETDKVVYDGLPEHKSFDTWDPRYFEDYIAQAKQYGFYRWFIIYNGTDFEPMNFGTAVTYLTNCVDWVRCTIDTSVGGCDKNYISGIVAGLIYFDKVKWFLEDTGLGVTERQFSMLRTNNNDIIGSYILKIANGLIGQSEKAFKRDNIGWSSYNDDRFAFDSVSLLAEWLELQEQYNKYKERVWDILQDLEALQLCTNNVNVIGNNININQGIECMQTVIKEENKIVVEEDNKVGGVDAEREQEPSQPAQPQTQTKTPQTQPQAPQSKPSPQPPQPNNGTKEQPQEDKPSNQSPEVAAEGDKIKNELPEEEKQKQKYIKIAVIVVLVIVVLILIYFAFFDKPKIPDNFVNRYTQPQYMTPVHQPYLEPLDLYSAPMV